MVFCIDIEKCKMCKWAKSINIKNKEVVCDCKDKCPNIIEDINKMDRIMKNFMDYRC